VGAQIEYTTHKEVYRICCMKTISGGSDLGRAVQSTTARHRSIHSPQNGSTNNKYYRLKRSSTYKSKQKLEEKYRAIQGEKG